MSEVRIMLRPRWKRVLIAPRVWVQFYRIFRGKASATESAYLATKSVIVMVSFNAHT